MNISELYEQPVGGVKQSLRTLGAKTLKHIPGMLNKATELAAKGDLGNTANNLYRQYIAFLGSNDKEIKGSTAQDLRDFFKSRGIKTKIGSTDTGVLPPSTIEKYIMDVAKEAILIHKGVQEIPKDETTTVSPDDQDKFFNEVVKELNSGKFTLAQKQFLVSLLK